MNVLTQKERRAYRTRRRIRRPVETGRLRLSVFRSAKHIYAQVIDDNEGLTVAEANTVALDLNGNKTEQARQVGKILAERALEAGVERIVFDRGSYRYHGRIKALAEGAREGGLDF
jgi:large subunit ribosomal protein L18